MSRVTTGAPAPVFSAASHVNPMFAFSSLGGHYVLLAFVSEDPARRDALFARLAMHRPLFESGRVLAFAVLRQRREFEQKQSTSALRYFLDEAGELHRRYGAEHGLWVLVDPMQRVLAFGAATELARLTRTLTALPAPELHAGVEMTAPVLIVPRILEPHLCRRLIEYYLERGGTPSGVMRQIGGKTVGVLDDFKSRRDVNIEDTDLQGDLRVRLKLRLIPEIAKAFAFTATRIERYIVACYDAAEGGYFRPHRDNTATATAHRKFAVSINLNAEEFEGGDLRFPEYGRRTYRPPTGGAVVFACGLLHEATPVTRGVRFATLPFLYDEEGEEVRQRNLHTLELSPALETSG